MSAPLTECEFPAYLLVEDQQMYQLSVTYDNDMYRDNQEVEITL